MLVRKKGGFGLPLSKAEASGRRVQETYTAVSLKEEEVFEARHAGRVGAWRSRKTGGLAAVASQKWPELCSFGVAVRQGKKQSLKAMN